jgi:hypothetical protein
VTTKLVHVFRAALLCLTTPKSTLSRHCKQLLKLFGASPDVLQDIDIFKDHLAELLGNDIIQEG